MYVQKNQTGGSEDAIYAENMRILAVNVLATAFKDLRSAAMRVRNEAIAFFLGEGADPGGFEWWCEVACAQPEKVSKAFLREHGERLHQHGLPMSAASMSRSRKAVWSRHTNKTSIIISTYKI